MIHYVLYSMIPTESLLFEIIMLLSVVILVTVLRVWYKIKGSIGLLHISQTLQINTILIDKDKLESLAD